MALGYGSMPNIIMPGSLSYGVKGKGSSIRAKKAPTPRGPIRTSMSIVPPKSTRRGRR
jgi:hypothetical protein